MALNLLPIRKTHTLTHVIASHSALSVKACQEPSVSRAILTGVCCQRRRSPYSPSGIRWQVLPL
ncbi:hypothetical protein H6F96_29885 [Microcoleus sp. FACHB-53]|nr:hypothetical protein [Microcoleus sp. FACHB-53]MBD2128643.1 hypothetical protein [Microcoleus sp. FACHB-1]